MRPQFSIINQIYFLFFILLFIVWPIDYIGAQEKKEETYSISLVQTAEENKKVYEIGDNRVLGEMYTVKKGDYIYRIFKKRGLASKRKLPQLISLLKKLNSSLTNIDLIHPGQKIIIPLKISPIAAGTKRVEKAPETPVKIETLRDLPVENYTVKLGDRLVKVVKDLYHIPREHLYDEYLNLIKKMNPSLESLDVIHVGQVIRLPIYSPQIVKNPIDFSPPELKDKELKLELSILRDQLGQIFTQIGEEWVQTGEHFIPLKSGGQISLKAESFPIINLSSGKKVIVDLSHALPEKMVRLIESSWGSYRVVSLGNDHVLGSAMKKVLSVCDYQKIYEPGAPLVLGGDIPIRITGDWIIRRNAGQSDQQSKTVVVTLLKDIDHKIPKTIRIFLDKINIKTVDYPSGDEPAEDTADPVEILEAGEDIASLILMVLNLTGQTFSREVKIPVYQSQPNFNLTVKADFFLNVKGRDSIIDLNGLGPDVISLLKEHRFLVLSLADEKNLTRVVTRTLHLLGIESNYEPHHFMAAERNEIRNIRLTIPGITFQDRNGQTIFATELNLPDEIAGFLSQKGYRILRLTLS